MESIREMQNIVSADHLIAYVFGVNKRFQITTTEPGLDAGTGGLQVLADAIASNPVHWAILFTGYGIVLVVALVFFVLNIKIFTGQFTGRKLEEFSNEQAIISQSVSDCQDADAVEIETFDENDVLCLGADPNASKA